MPRNRIPVETRLLTGARVRPQHKLAALARPPAGRPSMPKFLDGEARAEWRRMVGLLDKANTLAETHRAALTLYCLAWSNVCDLAAKLAAEKAAAVADGGAAGDALVDRRPSATAQALNKALAVCHRHLSELGLSPTAQGRVTPVRAGVAEQAASSDPVADRLAQLRVVKAAP